jgi:SAM-dependent methyltransferase
MSQEGPMKRPQFGNTAKQYAEWRLGFPGSFYDRLLGFDIGKPGQDLVDLGTGTGTLARGFGSRGLHVTAVDMDEAMLEQARRLADEEGLSIEFRREAAESIGLGNAVCDVVTAGQCWHWFEAEAVLKQVRRILRPGGHLVIAHFDWLPFKDNVVSKTEQLILSYSPQWKGAGGVGLYPDWLKQLGESGFGELESFSYDVLTPYPKVAWRARIQASAGIAALPVAKRSDFDEDLSKLLEVTDDDVLMIPHRVFAVIAKL